jgi:hypothetical protein
MAVIGNRHARHAFPAAGALSNRPGECPHAATLATMRSPMIFRMPRGFMPFADSTRYPDGNLVQKCWRREACESVARHERR